MRKISVTRTRDTLAARSLKRERVLRRFPPVSKLSVARESHTPQVVFLTLENEGTADDVVPLTPPDALQLSRALREAVHDYLEDFPSEWDYPPDPPLAEPETE